MFNFIVNLMMIIFCSSVSIPANPQMSLVFTAPQSELVTTSRNKASPTNNKKTTIVSTNRTSQMTQPPSSSHSTDNSAPPNNSSEYPASTEQIAETFSSEVPETSSFNVIKHCKIMGKFTFHSLRLSVL